MTPNRREMLQFATAGVLSSSGWLPAIAADAAKHPDRKKSVILLWLNGGPATIDLWDLKPGHEHGGPFREIETTAPGLKIGEHLPGVAKWGKHIAVVRSMATREGDHGRATYLAQTGYIPQGAIQFPAVGSLLSRELRGEQSDLPGFISISPRRNGDAALGGGFLGPQYSPLVVGGGQADELRVPDAARAEGVSDGAQQKRLEMLTRLDRGFTAGRGSAVAETLQSATARAVKLMRPEAVAAFRFEEEKKELRDKYGPSTFGQGCLLARRLVERGVPFVEVTLDGWDTHANNFDRVKTLCGTLDAGFSTLLADLSERGLLDSTLVVCMGEFGRTPQINGNTGRDHWPTSWATVLAGGGIKGGRSVGKTSNDGLEVTDRPVKIPDLVATVCKAVGIDPMKQNMSNVGRPIRIADPNATPIAEVL